MKNRISLSVRVSLLAPFALLAHDAMAQSSVTIYGVADAYFRTLKNGSASSHEIGSGGESTSRIGFKGVEDLGGGLAATFQLEGQTTTDTGTFGATVNGTNRPFNRQSTVGLQGNWGEVRLGRDLLPTWTAFSNFEVFSTVGVGNVSNLYNDTSAFGSPGRVRLDNLVAYYLPKNLGGFYGSFSSAFAEGAASGKYRGGRLGYAAGPLNVTAAYGETTVTATDKHKVALASASYDFGVVKLLGTLQETKRANAKNRLQTVALTSPVGNGTLKAAVARTSGDGILGTTNWGSVEATQVSLGYVYSLSNTQPAGARSTGLDVGIRHSF